MTSTPTRAVGADKTMRGAIDSTRTDRIGATAGVAFVLITLVGVVLYPNLHPPYPASEIQVAYVDRVGTTVLSAVLQLVGVVPFVAFLAALWRRLRKTDEMLAMITLLGGFATAVVILVWEATILGVVTAANRVDGADPRPILSVVTAMDQAVTLPLGIMLGAAGIAILSGGSLPRWLGWFGIIAAVAAIVGVVAILAVFMTDFGEIVAAANPLSLLLSLIWIVGVSVVLARSSAESGA